MFVSNFALAESAKCYHLSPSVQKIVGNFVDGQLSGKGSIFFKDKTKMKVEFHNGYINGQVLMFNKHKELQYIGSYENGVPHGPFWNIYDNEFIQIQFENGKLIDQNVILIDTDLQLAKIGALTNQTYFQNSQKIQPKFTDYNCVKVISSVHPHQGIRVTKTTSDKLPLKIAYDVTENRLIVRPSNILYFNRVPKTASMSFAFLIKALGYDNGYDVDMGINRKREVFHDDFIGTQEEMYKVLQIHENSAKCRHYAFFKLDGWNPDWFSIIRNPIERVIFKCSWRASNRPVGFRKSVLGSRLRNTHYPGRRKSRAAQKNARRGSVF